MAEQTDARQFFSDALTGRTTRREIFRRGAALGLSAAVLGGLAHESLRAAMAAEEGTLSVTYYNWIVDQHSPLNLVNEDFGKTFPVNAEVAPSENFGFDRFVTEAADKMSTYDMYIGVTPFLEMIALAESGTIEPWDPYLPAGILDDLPSAFKEEGSYNSSLYVWPFLLDVIIQGWNAGIVERAGLDPEVAPKSWGEYIANARKVVESGAAPFGCTFDFHDWRSLIPITHSISTDVYDPETGLFQYTSDAAVQALEIMKQMMEVANPDVLTEGATDGGVATTPDEAAFSAQQAGYLVKFQGAHLRCASTWQDPKAVRMGAMPKPEGGAGGTVFWTTGAVLFKYGFNKEQAAAYMDMLTHDDRIWSHSILGDPAKAETALGQLPLYTSTWETYKTNPPQYIADNPWATAIWDGLGSAKAITPTILSVTQFDRARPEWMKYLSGEESDAKTAMQKAQDAARAAYDEATKSA